MNEPSLVERRLPSIERRRNSQSRPRRLGMIAPRACALVALLILSACNREGIKQILDETRSPTHVVIEIRLLQTAMPTEDDLRLRYAIGQEIEKQHAGTIARATADVGRMDLMIDVKNTTTAIPAIHDVLKRFGVEERSTVRIAEH